MKGPKGKSKNRDAGTLETKAIQSVNKEAIRDMLLNNIIPTIHAQWLAQLSKDIIIQWDNSKPYQIPKDDEFQAATQAYGFNIQFVFQTAQSPDLNVLDLGLLNVIKSIEYQSFPKNLDELIEKMEEAFEEFDPIMNKHTWITLQSCMIEILEKQGGNNFAPPHMGKRRLDNEGRLPQLLKVDKGLITQAVNYLNTISIPATGVNVDAQDMEVGCRLMN
ncbi:uncharacterized protein LOC110739904 [Chenopodium quinoa]|uniref:uncharacterized protein LOC110739904 n=1 Tax=Chenopodium quinoa TaxID=63459 RepID=UPI000B783C89|nr:uncharacterized protein LOC110739904 [Chenopodium quinoa]